MNRAPKGPRAQRWRSRARTAEAMVLLTVASAIRRWVPMQRWAWLLGEAGPVPPGWRGNAATGLDVRAATPAEAQVARAVRRAQSRLPWRTSCLAEATAGQIMLRQRGEPGVVVIGLRRPDPEPAGAGEAGWAAHAWLLGQEGALTGGRAASGFSAATTFSPTAGRHTEPAG